MPTPRIACIRIPRFAVGAVWSVRRPGATLQLALDLRAPAIHATSDPVAPSDAIAAPSPAGATSEIPPSITPRDSTADTPPGDDPPPSTPGPDADADADADAPDIADTADTADITDITHTDAPGTPDSPPTPRRPRWTRRERPDWNGTRVLRFPTPRNATLPGTEAADTVAQQPDSASNTPATNDRERQVPQQRRHQPPDDSPREPRRPPTQSTTDDDPHWDARLLALADGTRIRALSAAAGHARLRAGMTVTEARARCGRLEILPWDPIAIGAAVTRVTAALVQASPQVTPAGGAPGT
nr:hypothetical protein [Gemmatimonadaceae bacterium]